MDYLKLRSEILSSERAPNYAANVVTNDMPKDPNYYLKDTAIADAINADPSLMRELVTTPVKRGDFLRVLNVVVGAVLFSKLKGAAESFEPLSYILLELEGDGLSVGSEAELDGFIALLQANISLTETDTNNIRSVFYQKRTVTPADVSIALRNY